MINRGVYGSELIKKRQDWPRKVNVYGINEYFITKNIGGVGYISGEWENIYFNIFIIEEPDYNIMAVSIFSGLTILEIQIKNRRMVNR